MFPILAAIAAPIISSIIGNIGAKDRQDAMNAYNTPMAQMARYSQAGLNPNLVYTQGTPGNQPGAAQFVTPEVDPVKVWSAATAAKESAMRRQNLYWRSRAQELMSDYQAAKNAAVIPHLGINAEYQSSLMHHQIQNLAINWGKVAAQGEGANIDNRIKEQILKIQKQNVAEKEYYNTLRQYGVEKGDNPLYRMGTLMLRKAIPHFRLH